MTVCPIILTDSHIIVGNGSNQGADVAMSGDVTIDDTGATTIKTSVALAGSPTTTTQSPGDNSTKIATTAYADAAGSGGTITLTGDVTGSGSGSIATTIKANVALAGNPTTTTQSFPDSSTKIATTEYVTTAFDLERTLNTVGFTTGSPTLGKQTGYFTFPLTGQIRAWSFAVDAGTATVKTWKIASGTAVPTSSNSISTSGVSISSGTAKRSTTLTDFTTTNVSAGDIFAFDLTAFSGCTEITFELEIITGLSVF